MGGHPCTTATGLMTVTEMIDTLNNIKKLYRFEDASKDNMVHLRKHTGYRSKDLRSSWVIVVDSCNICASSGCLASSRTLCVTFADQGLARESKRALYP